MVSLNAANASNEISARCNVDGKTHQLVPVAADNPQQEPFGGVEKREANLEHGLTAVYLVGVGYGGNNHTLRIQKNRKPLAQDQQYGVNNKIAFNGDRLNLRINIFLNQKSIFCIVD